MSKSKKTVEIEINLRPPSINGYYGHTGNRRYITKKGREFKEYVEWYLHNLKQKGVLVDFGDSRLKVEYEFHFKGKRKLDTGNFEKVLSDCLEGYLFDNDEQLDIIHLSRTYNNPEDKIYIKIIEL